MNRKHLDIAFDIKALDESGARKRGATARRLGSANRSAKNVRVLHI